MRVLIVDDTEINRRLARGILESEGYEVLEAKEGVEALAILRTTEVDAVLSDVMMPRMDGYTLVREMRRDPRWRAVPVLLASAVFREGEDVAAAQALGADGFVAQPFTAQGLRDALAALPKVAQHPATTPVEDSTVLRFALDRAMRQLITARARTEEVAEANVLLGERLQATQEELREALQERELRVRQWLDSGPVARLLLEDGDTVVQANLAASAMFGDVTGGLAGKSLRGLLAPHGGRQAEMLGRVVAHPELWPEGSALEFEFTRGNGDSFPAELSVVVLRDPAGRTLAAVTLRDLTERRRVQQALVDPTGQVTRFVESAHDLLFRLGPDTSVRYVSETSRELLGYEPGELIGRPGLDLVVPEDRDAAGNMLMRLMRHPGQRIVAEFRMRRAEGSAVWMEWAATSVVDPDTGTVQEILAVGRDVTQRRASEEALRSSEERFRLLADSLREVFFMRDHPGGRMLYVSPAYEVLWGRPRSELDEDPEAWARAIHAEDRPRLDRALADLGQGPVTVEFRLLRPDRSMRWVECRMTPVPDESGQVHRLVGTALDITERKAAEEDRARAERQARELAYLRELETFRQRFMNMAAHELSTPLTPLKMHAHLLVTGKAGPMTERQIRAVSSIDRNVDRLGRLVADLLDASRIQAERLKVQFVPTDLGALAGRAAEAYGPAAAAAKVRLEVACEGDLRLVADAGRLGQVLDNLLSNAIKFTPPGGVVRLAARREGAQVRVEVRDTGLGIAKADLPRLFQPFAQVHDPLEVTKPGTGLGLYISRGIVARHGGTITAASPGKGQGTTFTVDLPVTPPADAGEVRNGNPAGVPMNKGASP